MSDLPVFHDCHAHAVMAQKGGFLIALEGKNDLPYLLSNETVYAQQDLSRLLMAVPYVRSTGPSPESTIAKYHARREGYSPEWVSKDIGKLNRKIVLLDTLNSVDWPSRCYLELALNFPKTQFVMCHAGGYDVLEFVKMARFVPNVWIDFSATQTIFGWVGKKSNLPPVTDVIDHAYGELRIARKLMFGSDVPGFDQADAVREVYRRVPDSQPFFIDNFERLLEVANVI